MVGVMRYGLAALSVSLGIIAALPAHAAEARILREGFCVRKSEKGCADVVLPDTLIDIARLPKDGDGKTIVYFYTVARTDARTILVHVLDAEEGKTQVAYEKLNGDVSQSEDLKPKLDTLIEKLAPEGSVVVTPFLVDPSAGATAVLISSIRVTGPGALHADVVDLMGDPVPASERLSINVVQNAH